MADKLQAGGEAEERKGVIVLKNLASRFSAEAREELDKQLGIELDDDHDYSEGELLDLYERITEDFPADYDLAGNPMRLGRIFEDIVDVLTGLDELA